MEILATKYTTVFSIHDTKSFVDFLLSDAKLKQIHPPVYWKPLHLKNIEPKRSTVAKFFKKANDQHTYESSCSQACNYTTLVYRHGPEHGLGGKEFHIFVDFEHNTLEHASWKKLIENDGLPEEKLNTTKDESLVKGYSWSNLKSRESSFIDQYLKQQELIRYFKTHIRQNSLFKLDKTSYPNRPMPMSRRPRDVLHIDFYQATRFKELKTETTFKTFYHRKYLVNTFELRISNYSPSFYLISYLSIYMNIH